MLLEDKIAMPKLVTMIICPEDFYMLNVFTFFFMVELLRIVMHNAFNIPLS